MYTQQQEEKEYLDFIKEFAEKSADLINKYQKLSAENQKRVSSLCRRIVTVQGIAGMMDFIKDPLNF